MITEKNNIFNKSIKNLKGLGKIRVNALRKVLNIYTYEDLITFYPKKYIYIYSKKISELSFNDTNIFVSISGFITDIKKISYKKDKKKYIITAYLYDFTGIVKLIWFSNIIKSLSKINKYYITIIGKPQLFHNKIQFVHPYLNKYEYKKNRVNYIFSIYNLPICLKKIGINNMFFTKLIRSIFNEIDNKLIKNFFFINLIDSSNFLSRKKALIQIHFPESLYMLSRAKYILKFESLFFIKLFFLSKEKIVYSKPFKKIGNITRHFCKYHLPFKLTSNQKKVFKEIWEDLKKPIQMKRLVQGEVGSGKTIIAILSILSAIDNKFQVCFMVPTEMLAKQHFNLITNMFPEINKYIVLLTSSTPKKYKLNIFNRISVDKILVVIGTHSIIHNNIKFYNLGLVIIDEQQRFGVDQREKIYNNNYNNNLLPHILIMTATPIPRTLSKVIYTNLTISILKNSTSNRKNIKTLHLYNEQINIAFKTIENQILKGKQAYIVYPTINDSTNRKSLMCGYKTIKKKFNYIKNSIGILHGEMNAKEKEKQMKLFVSGKNKIMMTTTVIEVGIDIPNASVIVIEDANVFGLSQLHQLRGRIGRSYNNCYCFLITKKDIKEKGLLRIKIMCKTNMGLEISNEDLRIRGGGNLLGTQQSGKKFLKTIDFIRDVKLMKQVIYVASRFYNENKKFLIEKKNIIFSYYRKYKNFLT